MRFLYICLFIFAYCSHGYGNSACFDLFQKQPQPPRTLLATTEVFRSKVETLKEEFDKEVPDMYTDYYQTRSTITAKRKLEFIDQTKDSMVELLKMLLIKMTRVVHELDNTGVQKETNEFLEATEVIIVSSKELRKLAIHVFQIPTKETGANDTGLAEIYMINQIEILRHNVIAAQSSLQIILSKGSASSLDSVGASKLNLNAKFFDDTMAKISTQIDALNANPPSAHNTIFYLPEDISRLIDYKDPEF